MIYRDPARIPEVLRLLGEVWQKAPELRLGQLLLNHIRSDSPSSALYNIEDDELLRLMGVQNPPSVRPANPNG